MSIIKNIKAVYTETPWWIWVVILLSALLICEALVYVATIELNLPYYPFPYSYVELIAIIRAGAGWAIFVPFILILCLIIGGVLTFQRSKIGHVLLVFPIGILIGSVLGNLMFTIFGDAALSLSPFYVFHMYHAYGQDGYLLACYASGFLFGLGIVYSYLIKNVWLSAYNVHGESRFATLFDLFLWKMLWQGKEGIFLGRYFGLKIFSRGFEHLAIFVPSGGGKSSTIAIPNIMLWKGSSINNDMSHELYESTAKYLRQQKGAKVFCFSPSIRKTHRWNLFEYAITLPDAERYSELQRVCEYIIPAPKESGAKGQEWAKYARRVITGLTAYLIHENGYVTLGDLAELVCRGDFENFIRKEARRIGEVVPQFGVNLNAYFSIVAEETRSGIKFNVDAYLDLFLDPIVRAATSASDFRLSDLRKDNIHVFVGIPDSEQSRLAPLLTMFWEEVGATFMRKKYDEKTDQPIFLNVDEKGNMNRLDKLRKNVNAFRKYGVRVAWYFQYKDQAGDNYSEKEMKAFTNSKTKLIYTQSDPADAEWASKLFGQRTKRYFTRTRKTLFGSGGYSEQVAKKPLISADQISRLDDGSALISIDGKYGVKGKKAPYYKDSSFKHLRSYKTVFESDRSIPTQEPMMPKVFHADGGAAELDDMCEEAIARREKAKQESKSEIATTIKQLLSDVQQSKKTDKTNEDQEVAAPGEDKPITGSAAEKDSKTDTEPKPASEPTKEEDM
jgi:type IV secretion system protein VirD4